MLDEIKMIKIGIYCIIFFDSRMFNFAISVGR